MCSYQIRHIKIMNSSRFLKKAYSTKDVCHCWTHPISCREIIYIYLHFTNVYMYVYTCLLYALWVTKHFNLQEKFFLQFSVDFIHQAKLWDKETKNNNMKCKDSLGTWGGGGGVCQFLTQDTRLISVFGRNDFRPDSFS